MAGVSGDFSAPNAVPANMDSTVIIGEIYKFTYKYSMDLPFHDVRQDVETALIADAVHFKVLGVYEEKGTKTITAWCEVVNNPLPFMVVFGVCTLIGVGAIGLVTWLVGLTFGKAEKILASPAGAAAVSSFSLVLIVGAALAVKYFLLR